MAEVKYPTKLSNGRIFGDVGFYNRNDGTLDKTKFDNMITYLDINAIENYYKYKDTSGVDKGLTEQQMRDAGFGELCGDSDGDIDEETGEKIVYKTFLDIPYKVHEVTEINGPFATVTAYERLIRELCSSMREGGYITTPYDINLDGTFSEADYTYLSEYLDYIDNNNILGRFDTLYNYIYEKEKGNGITTGEIYQRIVNVIGSNTVVTERDLAIMSSRLKDIFKVKKVPVDTSIFSGKSVSFSVQLGLTLESGYEYRYEWSLSRWVEDSEKEDGGSWEPVHLDAEQRTESEGIIEDSGESYSILTIHNVTTDLNGTLVSVLVAKPVVPNSSIEANTPYTDENYYVTRTYAGFLYVVDDSDDILRGDINNDGIVNIVDAYAVLNDFIYNRGDVDRDGAVSSVDASWVLTYYAARSTGSTSQQWLDDVNSSYSRFTLVDILRGDIDQNGIVDARDASTILGIYADQSTGKTIQQCEEEYGVIIDVSGFEKSTRTIPDLYALVKSTQASSRPTAINKNCGELILSSIKDKKVKLY